jgi:hypothetical protein
MNKFLRKYPQLWEPRVGDKVKVIRPYPESVFLGYYYVGAVAIIDKIEWNGRFVGDFNNFQYIKDWKGRCTIGEPLIHFELCDE